MQLIKCIGMKSLFSVFANLYQALQMEVLRGITQAHKSKKQRRTMRATPACSNETLYVRPFEPDIVAGSYEKYACGFGLHPHQINGDDRSKALTCFVRERGSLGLSDVDRIVFSCDHSVSVFDFRM